MTALATTDDVAAVSRAVPDSDTTKVERLLEMVSANVRRYVGLTFDLVEDDELTVYPVDSEVVMPEWPITEATAVQQGAAVTVEIGTSGRLYRLVNGLRQPWPPYPVTVTYTHGWADIPLDVVQVVAEVVADQWNATTANPMGLSSASKDVGGYTETQSFRAPYASTEEWSARHDAVLDRYKGLCAGSVRVS